MADFDLLGALRLIENDERVDLHARGTCGEAIKEIERLTSQRDEWKEKWKSMTSAALTMGMLGEAARR